MNPKGKAPDMIVHLLRKIQALAQDASAPHGERLAAYDKLERLLMKHGLTIESLQESTTQWVEFEVKPKTEAFDLLIQIFFQVCDRPKATFRSDGKTVAFELTAAQAADIRASFMHYLPMLCAELRRIEKHRRAVLKDLTRMRKSVVLAMAVKYELHSEREGDKDDGRGMSHEEIANIIAIAQRLNGDKWERPAPSLGDDVLRLTA